MPDTTFDPAARPSAPPAPDAPPLVSILVISYNTRAMTLDCLRSVIAETTVPYELIVLDNASPDGSAAAIAEAFPDIRLIASPENLGFAKGNNVAARRCARQVPAAPEPRHAGARAGGRPHRRLRRAHARGADLGRPHAQRRPQPQPLERLRPAHPLEPVLPRLRARARLPPQRLLQPRGDGRLGPRRRARRRRGAGQLLSDPPRPLAGTRRLRSHLRHVRRGAGPLPARRARAAPGRG